MPTSARAPSPVGADTPGWLLLPLRGNSPSVLIGPYSPAPYRVGGDVAKEDGLPRQRARWLAMTGRGGPPLFPHPPSPPSPHAATDFPEDYAYVTKEDGLPRQRARWLAMTGRGGPPLFPHPPSPPSPHAATDFPEDYAYVTKPPGVLTGRISWIIIMPDS